MKALRRFGYIPKHENLWMPSPAHQAVIDGHSIFPSTVVNASDSPRLLVDGINSRKIGNKVIKGAWKGYRIYTLTLEERVTCPRSCHHWRSCYGNTMPFSRRIRVDRTFIPRLRIELATFDQKRKSFVVRLHVLGDFYSVEYVRQWEAWLDEFPRLHVFGYTAWPVESEIGFAVRDLSRRRWTRFAVRTSVPKPNIGEVGPAVGNTGIVCPAQTHHDKNISCGSCGLCWAEAARDKPILFIEHGRQTRKPRAQNNVAENDTNSRAKTRGTDAETAPGMQTPTAG